jgi:hypothetical protein
MSLDRPIVVIGAARSGTKILRDTLGRHPGLVAVPYDVNFVWKYGHYGVAHDELQPTQLRPGIRAYIRKQLAGFCSSSSLRLIEKTVGNALRVGYVRAVLPDARFIHLIRDGRAVTESSMRQWRAPMDLRRSVVKLRHVPPSAMPTYAVQYARSYVRRRLNSDGRVSTWGPRWSGIDEVATTRPLVEVCALQWLRCVESARQQLSVIDPADVIEIRYEDFVNRPVEILDEVVGFAGLAKSDELERAAVTAVTKENIGKWSQRMERFEVESMERLLGPMLGTLGYV